MPQDLSLEHLQELLRAERRDELRQLLADVEPADTAELIADLPGEARAPVFLLLDIHHQAAVLSELEPTHVEQISEVLSEEYLADLAERMAPDDQVDLLADLDDEQSNRVLAAMEPEDRRALSELLDYQEDTAGHIMTPEMLALPATASVQQARLAMGAADFSDPVLYVYILAPGTRRMIGQVTLKNLFSVKLSAKLGDIAERDFIYSTPDEDQEAVARKFRKYNIWVMPVLDEDGRLLGRITVDDIIEVLEEEADEDLAIRVGAPDIDDDEESPVHVARKRLPWLLVTMFAGLANSVLIKTMLDVTSVVAIAIFIPAILAMGGNTGMQSATVGVRGVALGQKRYRRLWSVVWREMAVGVCLGFVCGTLTALVVAGVLAGSGADTGGLSHPLLALTVGMSMANAMIFASSFGAVMPIALNRLGIDPAIAAGPFITTFNDLSASLIYFCTCVLLLRGI